MVEALGRRVKEARLAVGLRRGVHVVESVEVKYGV